MSKSEQSFRDYPLSVAEIKSDKSHNAVDWTPRDALIACLRDIDNGDLQPTALVICVQEPGSEPGAKGSKFFAACPDPHTTLGLLEAVKFKLLGPDDG
jgi:hypothetical protein